MRKGKLFVISGPSGSGKTTIVRKVVEQVSDIDFAVSCTTRSRREGENEGIDYRYITREQFERMIENDEFVEWAEVYGNLYGTPVSDIVNATNEGKDILLDIDVQGASAVGKNYKNCVSVFIVPATMEELKDRLLKRKNESDINLDTRLNTARKEVAHIDNYDYIIINKDIEESVKSLTSIITAERMKKDEMIDLLYEKFMFTDDYG